MPDAAGGSCVCGGGILMKAFLAIASMAAGNFICEAMFDGDYGAALDRSFLQGIAIAVYVLVWERSK